MVLNFRWVLKLVIVHNLVEDVVRGDPILACRGHRLVFKYVIIRYIFGKADLIPFIKELYIVWVVLWVIDVFDGLFRGQVLVRFLRIKTIEAIKTSSIVLEATLLVITLIVLKILAVVAIFNLIVLLWIINSNLLFHIEHLIFELHNLFIRVNFK